MLEVMAQVIASERRLEDIFIPYVGLESVLQGFTGNVLLMKMKQERYENHKVSRVFTRAMHKVCAIC